MGRKMETKWDQIGPSGDQMGTKWRPNGDQVTPSGPSGNHEITSGRLVLAPVRQNALFLEAGVRKCISSHWGRCKWEVSKMMFSEMCKVPEMIGPSV